MVTGISISPVGGEDRAAARVIAEMQTATVTVEAGMDGMDPRLIAKILHQLGESDGIRLERVDIGEFSSDPTDESTDIVSPS